MQVTAHVLTLASLCFNIFFSLKCRMFSRMKQSWSLPVIVLDDITHCPDGCQVFIIAFRVDIVGGLGRGGIPVRACEINGNLARVQERIRIKQ